MDESQRPRRRNRFPSTSHHPLCTAHRANKSLAKVGFRVKQRGARPLMSLACVRCFQLFTYRRSHMRFHCQHQNSALKFTNAGGRAPVRPPARSLARTRERSTRGPRCSQNGAHKEVGTFFKTATTNSACKRSAELNFEARRAKSGGKHNSITLVSCQSHAAWLKGNLIGK